MSEQRHRIKRQVIELQVQGSDDAWRLQQEVSRIYRQRIIPLIDRCCSELSAPDRLYRIESLELDLGTIDPERLDKDLVAKVEASLGQALAQQINALEQSGAGRPDQDLQARSELELFAFFARTGSLPWWAEASHPRLLEESLRRLVEDAPGPLRRLIRELVQEPRPLLRIVCHYDDAHLTLLAALLAPAWQEHLVRDTAAWIQALGKTRAGRKRSPAQLRRIAWQQILIVAARQGEQPAAASYYRELLPRLAIQLSTGSAALTADIRQYFSQDEEAISPALRQALEPWSGEQYGPAPAEGDSIGQNLARLKATEDLPRDLWQLLQAITPRLPDAVQKEWQLALNAWQSHVSQGKTVPAAVIQEILRLLSLEPALTEEDSSGQVPARAETARDLPLELWQLLQAITPRLPDAVQQEWQLALDAWQGQISQGEAIPAAANQDIARLLSLEPALTEEDSSGQVPARAETARDLPRELWQLLQAITPRLPDAVQQEWQLALDAWQGQISQGEAIPAAAMLEILQLLSPEPALTEEDSSGQVPARSEAAGNLPRELWQLLQAITPRLLDAVQQEWQLALDAWQGQISQGEVIPAAAMLEILRLLSLEPAAFETTRDGPSAADITSLRQALIAFASQQTISPTTADDPVLDLSFSDGDALYISNAGLVILWPFLDHFFGCLNLLQESRFADHEARQRAIGLLQHLATGDTDFPEYLLPLNKVLCGLEPDALSDFGAPLTDDEAQESNNLLQAAVAQAPILHDMPVDALRGTFLLRPGALRARDGAWLLQVERETYDIVLDRFPWNWTWIKLPWMEAPLQVEW